MKISDLKKLYKEKLFEKAYELGEINPEVKIGTENFTFIFDDKYAVLSVRSGTVKCEHLILEIKIHAMSSKEYFPSINSEETKRLIQYYKLMVEYWSEYAKVKGLKGVLYLPKKLPREFHREAASLSKLNVNQYDLFNNLVKSEVTNIDLIGGVLFQESIETWERFLSVKQLVSEVLTLFPLMTPLHSNAEDLNYMYHSPIWFHFKGEKFALKLLSQKNDFDLIEVIFEYNSEKDNFFILPSIEEIKAMLHEFELNNRLKNEIDNPMVNFEKVIKGIIGKRKEENFHREFDKLVSFMGSWEAVEQEFIDISSRITLEILNTEDKISYKQVRVHRMQSNEQYYYLIDFKNLSEGFHENFEILYSQDKNCPKVKKHIAELIIGDI